MKRIFKIEGGLIPEYLSDNIRIFQLVNFYSDSDYINYDNHYISLTRQDYGDSEIEFYLPFSNPGQLVGGVQMGYSDKTIPNITTHRDDIQITGHSFYESIVYENDCIGRGRALNNFIERSDLHIFYLPDMYISGATKILTGITTGSTGVYIVDSIATGITFVSIFTANTVPFFTNSIRNGVKFELYYRMTPTNISIGGPGNPFLFTPIINNPVFNPNTINSTRYFNISDLVYKGGTTGSTYSAVTYTFSLNGLEGEFLIKKYYKWSNFTYFAKLLDKDYLDIENSIIGNPYEIYNLNSDFYFIYLQKADKPQVSSTQVVTPNFDLNILTIRPSFNGQISFPLPNQPTSKPIVTVNGSTLSNLEYNLTGQTLMITSGVLYTTDYINIIYSLTVGSQTIQTESYKITSIPIASYPPNTSTKVIYNSGTTKYEYWLNIKSKGNVIVTINGQTLSNNIDYYVSSSDSRRIIFEDTLLFNDIVNVYYNAIIGNNKINTPSYQISWRIPPPANNMGYFTVEVANYSDTNFTSPIFSGITLYEAKNDLYFTTVLFSGNYGTKYIYRVKNQKNYYTVLGELLYTVNYSDIIPITINTNALNNY